MTSLPNIVMVTVDSLRADHCGFLGYDGGTTPVLDGLAAEGVSFRNAVSPGPTTADSMPVIFTGEEVHDRAFSATRPAIAHHMRARDTLAERLARRGYTTGAFTANPWTSRYFEFDAGFDHFEDFMDSDRSRGLVERAVARNELKRDWAPLYALRLLLNWSQERNMFQSWQSFYDDAVAWTRSVDAPYFLWLFLVDVHVPYLPPAAHRRGSKAGMYASNLWLYGRTERFGDVFRPRALRAYDDAIRSVDAHLGRLVDDLADDEPVVVVHADHGESFGEHGVFGHGHNLFEEQVHVPLVVSGGPSGTVPSQQVTTPVSLARIPELLTTVADGGDVRELAEPVVRTRNYDPTIAARGETWKYVREPTGETLFDVVDGEDRERDDPELLATARQVVDDWESASAERERITGAARALVNGERL